MFTTTPTLTPRADVRACVSSAASARNRVGSAVTGQPLCRRSCRDRAPPAGGPTRTERWRWTYISSVAWLSEIRVPKGAIIYFQFLKYHIFCSAFACQYVWRKFELLMWWKHSWPMTRGTNAMEWSELVTDAISLVIGCGRHWLLLKSGF